MRGERVTPVSSIHECLAMDKLAAWLEPSEHPAVLRLRLTQ
jgi:hypothetical protein